jgi:hypothetical protein
MAVLDFLERDEGGGRERGGTEAGKNKGVEEEGG